MFSPAIRKMTSDGEHQMVTSKQSWKVKIRKLTKHARWKVQTRKPDQTSAATQKENSHYRVRAKRWEGCSAVGRGADWRTHAVAKEGLGPWPQEGAAAWSSSAGKRHRLGWGVRRTTGSRCHKQEKCCRSRTKWSNGKTRNKEARETDEQLGKPPP